MSRKTPIAVVGMACMFPRAADLSTYWKNILSKVNTSRTVSASRWILPPESLVRKEPAPDRPVSDRCCLIDPFDFDANGFQIDPPFLKNLDPLYHLVLKAGKDALLTPESPRVNQERTGVILAALALPTDGSSSLTRDLLGAVYEKSLFGTCAYRTPDLPRAMAARVTSLPAALLARALGLKGGSYTLDAACASSLYAIKLACDELRAHRCDAMLAGGVSRPDCLYTQIGFSQLRALSPTGRCAPFDQSADGLVVGEGAGLVVLKRLDDAVDQGDTIHAVIRGIGVSNDTRGNLLAPDSAGQLRAMQMAYELSGWSPDSVDLIECHGAGTPVGDATELHSLRELWRGLERPGRTCAIGSVKSMIGHTLTAAGAAGFIKTVLALEHKCLPPSLHFNRPAAGSPLHEGPFKVQTEAEDWIPLADGQPRRAAVSAFGFGGINAHLLVEEWSGDSTAVSKPKTHASSVADPSASRRPSGSPEPVAIIGMDTLFGPLTGLQAFQEALFNGHSQQGQWPERRLKHSADILSEHGLLPNLAGYLIEQLDIALDEFHIPPNELPDILPQHLLMLKVAAGAMQNAGMSERVDRPQMGTVIGLDFDFEANNYHFRWFLDLLIQRWLAEGRLRADPDEIQRWQTELKDSWCPPLTAPRVLGALPSIVASRIAREFKLGGASFVVSSEETSGLRALEIGMRSLQRRETDAVLVGAVDIVGDVRRLITFQKQHRLSSGASVRALDANADGTLCGDGAAALVIKRLDDALADGDRIYAAVESIGSTGGGGIEPPLTEGAAYRTAIAECLAEADVEPSDVNHIEPHGSGDPAEDRIEAETLQAIFDQMPQAASIGTSKPLIGHTGAASGLASIAKAALSLYQEILPPAVNYARPAPNAWNENSVHVPIAAQYWYRNRSDGPRRSLIGALTPDGNSMAVLLKSQDVGQDHPQRAAIRAERSQPLGDLPYGLFFLSGANRADLLEDLDRFSEWVRDSARPEAPPAGLAARWHQQRGEDRERAVCLSILCGPESDLKDILERAVQSVREDQPVRFGSRGGVAYTPRPLGPEGRIAFVYPGSGNHYLGMGQAAGTRWPDILRAMDADTPSLLSQSRPDVLLPRRLDWRSGWERAAYRQLVSDPVHTIFGQVMHGGLVTGIIRQFEVQPSSVIGYSLGETSGYFALGLWPERDLMLTRMLETDLFSDQLAGVCLAARNAWKIAADQEFVWSVAVVNRPSNEVAAALEDLPYTRLLLVNTPEECVIGGDRVQVQTAVQRLGSQAVFLDGVVTVHCDAAGPVADAYRRLHLFETRPPEHIVFYSCALGKAYPVTDAGAADSILKQALEGFDFTRLIRQAHSDGLRIFVELGPGSSCTRMIGTILGDRPHLALSVSQRGEDEALTVLKALGTLMSHRVPVNLDPLYGSDRPPVPGSAAGRVENRKQITVVVGGNIRIPAPPAAGRDERHPIQEAQSVQPDRRPPEGAEDVLEGELDSHPFSDFFDDLQKNIASTAEAHRKFLAFSDDMARSYAETFNMQTRMLEQLLQAGQTDRLSDQNAYSSAADDNSPQTATHGSSPSPVAFDREQCMTFAVGKIADVLGPEFAEVDRFAVRVRLPDEPLMLVDRIVSISGDKGSMTSGRIVTEHDVLPGAWYLDAQRAPVCISVEAGQADLFLSSYLGIDLAVQGRRSYRLLDASIQFHRGLPRPGETIRYEIEIEKFIRHGQTYMFFFHFDGFIGSEKLITMTDGCAGFFTEDEIQHSGGIITTAEERKPQSGRRPADWQDLVPMSVAACSAEQLERLRQGDLAACFGAHFEGCRLPQSLWLPGGRMRLIDRVTKLDPRGGRFGLGMVRAEADIHADDWFLTCHFIDDMTMPGTLMYECCAHTLRVLLQRMGWICENPRVRYEPLVGTRAVLKCRGPVTPNTRQVVYEVELKEIGYEPEPYVLADAHMYGDGRYIVRFTDMSLKMSGCSRQEIEAFWQARHQTQPQKSPASAPVLYSREQILAFAVGNPSEAFGEPYLPFDTDRFIARLPGPPYAFMDRVTRTEPQPWKLQPGGWIHSEYDVPGNAWYFRADRSGSMPYCVLLEIALQPCGWLAAYAGSALTSQNDLHFRNLDGNAKLLAEVWPDAGTLEVRCRITKISTAGDMIIEGFDFEVRQNQKPIFAGDTVFGFFTELALSQQKGIQQTGGGFYQPTPAELDRAQSFDLQMAAPLDPDDPNTDAAAALTLPSKALLMIDRIDALVDDGGPVQLGYIRGIKRVDPAEWFFKAHFYRDPVCPGSLGVESFLQLIKVAALMRWPDRVDTHRFAPVLDVAHQYQYRGQILPKNKTVTVEAVITAIKEQPQPVIMADGQLSVDGLTIYQMKNFGLRLVKI